ncbi:ABC transporter permease [Aliibacillus thermotolerans]|uniref:ABC transporter permease n=1 Tax=Aliibacillus thermotolerans TaxID=1834418 RepID=A0ABW0U5G7_9BACI|nr:ABC transporter permease [Aliibacillus thermotolerans]MDA3129421.1 ABC transporter permease [Aliibacillus thermotolerans]
MTNLIKAEMFKLQRNRTFWALIATVAGLSTFLHYLVIIDWWQMHGTVFDRAGLSELDALSTFTVPLFFNLIVSTLAGFFISIEFSNSGVIRNQIISGHKRSHIFIAKLLVFSLGSIIVTVLIPVITAIIIAILFGQGDGLSLTHAMYLGRAYGLFTLQFLAFASIIMLLAIITGDQGKTIILSILFTIAMFAVEKLSKPFFLEMVYENTIFYQFTEVFQLTMTNGEIMKSIIIGVLSCMMISLCGILVFNRKEIK